MKSLVLVRIFKKFILILTCGGLKMRYDYVRQVAIWIFVMAIGMLVNPVVAATVTWDGGGTGDLWSTPENWSTDLAPVVADDVELDGSISQGPIIDETVTAVCNTIVGPGSGQTMQVSGGTLGITADWTMPGDTGVDEASLEISDGTITVGNLFAFAQDGDAYLHMTGGTINGMYFKGSDTDDNGLIIMDGGTVYMGQGIQLGGMGTMSWIVNDGSIQIPTSSADYFRVGANYGTTAENKGYFEVNGGTHNIRKLRLGQTTGSYLCDGVMRMTGGTITFPTDAMIGVTGAGAYGTLIMESGTFNTAGLVAGAGAHSTIQMSGGTINVSGNFMDARSCDTASSYVEMSGGEINTFTLRLSEYTEAPSNWVVTDGKINVSSYFKLQTGTYFELKGGAVEITNTSSVGLVMLDYTSGHGVLDISGTGKLLLHWDARTQIDDLTADGKIVAYGGDGQVVVVYDPEQDITQITGKRFEVESVRSAYLNDNTAILAFQYWGVNDIDVELTFRDHITGTSPASPIQVTVYASQGGLQEENIDISNWPDGDYEVLIQEVGGGSQDTGTMIRGIRKQTITAPQAPSEPIDVAGKKILFVDDWYIASQSGLTREVEEGQAIPIAPWESNPDYYRYINWVRDFWIGQDGKMYVKLHGRNGQDSSGNWVDVVEYWVVSDDYENWSIVSEPENRDYSYNVITFDKAKVQYQFSGTPSYDYYDPEEDGPVNLGQVSVYESESQPMILGDITLPNWSRIAVWERPNGEYLILTPEPIVKGKWEFDDNEIGEWQDSNDNYGPEHLSMDGNTLRFYQARTIPRNDPFRVYYDNLPASRMMVTWSTQDGVNWTPTYFDMPDEQETPGLQHYAVHVFNEEEDALELSYVRMYNQVTQITRVDLAYSRDGIQWNRFDQQPFFDSGEFGSWNFGFAFYTIRMRLDTGSEYIEPIAGMDGPHFMFTSAYGRVDRSYITEEYFLNRFDGMFGDEEKGLPASEIWDWYGSSWDNIVDATKDLLVTPGLIKYRKDGWVRLGNSTDTGTLTTKVLSAAQTLNINAKTDPNGYILVEVLDEYGNGLSNYSGSSGAEFAGDSVNYPLRWNDWSIKDLPNRPIKLRITIHKGQLYSLNFGGYNDVIYVDADATGQDDGSSWTNAFCDLQDALARAEYGDQIWVAEGTYKPTQDVNADLACYEAFELKNGVAVYGGFAGSETSLSQRDYENNVTLLSGDLAGDDGPNFTNNDENSRHVIIGDDTDETTILDGFAISGGNAKSASPHNAGGGLIVWTTGSPTLQNCKFIGNSATTYGGAIYAGKSSSKIQGCRFEGNISRSGGAIRLQYSGDVEIDDCIFIENGGDTAAVDTVYGGAISNYGSDSVVISNSYFIGNQTILGQSSVGYGGAIVATEPGITDILSCVFNSNQSDKGGVIRFDGNISNVINCTFAGNAATIAGKALSIGTSSSTIISINNSILWNDGSEINYYGTGVFWVEYSDVYGGWSGEGNINLNPNFTDPDGADNIAGTEDDNYRLTAPSPCIDSGLNTAIADTLMADLDGNNRIANTSVDMGAYEYGSTVFLGICGDALHPISPGDTTEDCRVNIEDMVVLAANWLTCTAPTCDPIPPGDMTGDCRVNIGDLVVLVENWLTCTAPECD